MAHQAVADPGSILVIKPSSLGDIVHALPAVAMLHARWPSAKIRWLANTEWMPVLEGNPQLAEVVEFPRARFRGAGGAAASVVWAWKVGCRVTSDLVLDFQGLFRSAAVGRLAKGGRLLGLSDAREGAGWFYDEVADVSGERHSVGRYLALAELATGSRRPERLEFVLPDGRAPQGFAWPPGYVVLHPFSRGRGKSLDAEAALELASLLRSRNPVLLVGRGGPRLPDTLPEGICNLIDRTSLPELVWLMRHASATVSVDSGPLHLAAALCPRVVGIHSWSEPAKVGPYQPRAIVWCNGRLAAMQDYLDGTVAANETSTARLPTRDELAQIAEAASG